MNALTPARMLSGKQIQAAEAIADGASQRQVARTLGINRKTIAAWMANPAFLARVEELRTERCGIFISRRALPVPGRIIGLGLAGGLAAAEARALLPGTIDRAHAV